MPFDFSIGPYRELSGISFLSGAVYSTGGGVTLLSYLRPFLMFSLLLLFYNLINKNNILVNLIKSP